ncbi:hypothetical protein [Pontibacter roseus]|uniref:hypothetical protein n=1 Tax=Pontibacter roseus TaxID=336989 RepID=UPI00036567E7|nr:hypothetical protein [Pontibacter roseus]
MKIILSILLILSSVVAFAQKKNRSYYSGLGKEIANEKLKVYLDSLKTSLLTDTVNFKRSDLVHTSTGTRNTKLTSPLIKVNGKFSYKLDIIEGNKVAEFTEQLLDYELIDRVAVVEPKASQAIYGSLGEHVTILITTKKTRKFNPQVAGLVLDKKSGYGDNFSQRKQGEILLSH